MFGYLRFILAIFVILSHLDIRFFGLNQGVIAVVIFYILAGFVVSYIYTIYNDYKLFILDRIKRIFPLYLFILSLTIVFLLITNFGNPHFTIFNIFSNITIIPLNFYMWIDNSIITTPKWWLIPPAWSLGTELQAYLLLPFTFFFKKIKYLLIFISLYIYILANFNLIHPDYFGYRLIVGVFFIFMLGTSLQKISINQEEKFDYIYIYIVWFISLSVISILIYYNIPIKAYSKETAIGILIGIPIIYNISKINKKLPFNSFLGKLSYGIFLSHFLAIWIADEFSLIDNKNIKIVFISLILALIGVYVEKIYIEKEKSSKKSVEKM